MSEPLREQIARALRESFYPDRKSRAPESEWLRRADAVLPVVEAEIERLRARAALAPASDQLPVPEQTTEAPEHPDPERWPGTTERPWFVEGLTAMDRFRSRVIFFVGDSDQDRADLEMIVEAVNAYCPSAWTPEVEP